MKNFQRRFNLGICIFRMIVNLIIVGGVTAAFYGFLKWEAAKAIYPVVIIGYFICIAVVAIDFHFIIKDIRFIKSKSRQAQNQTENLMEKNHIEF